jgi:hypothetical protein
MTARPLDPDSRRRPVYSAVALVLLLAMVMAAGFVSPGFGSQNQTVNGLPCCDFF